MGDFFIFAVVLFIIVVSVIGALIDEIRERAEKYEEEEEDIDNNESCDIKPEFKPLTDEQIKEIHSRGKITPEEKVKEWENLDLCAPGDAIGSASWRCEKFNNNCHNCLVDFANEKDEYTSIYNIFKVSNANDTESKE